MADIILGRLKFKWQGDWTDSTAYIKDDIIRYGGNTYVCTVNHTSDASDFYVDLSAQRWNLMTPGFEWKGSWLPSSDAGAGAVRYKINDVISYGPNVYVCLQGHATSLTFEPDLDAGYWQLMTTGFANKGPWTDTLFYTVGDVVTYGAAVYICIEDHTPDESTNTNPPNGDYWQLLVDGMQFKGTYDVDTAYVPGDVVTFGGWNYVATQNTEGNRPDNTTYFDLLTRGYEYQGEFVPGVGTEYLPGQVITFSGKVYSANKVTTSTPPSNDWDMQSEGMKWKGEWDGSTTYYPGDLASTGGTVYLCIATNQSNVSPKDDANWEKLLNGQKWKGAWNADDPYFVGEIVKHGARTYICTQDEAIEGANPLRSYYMTVVSTASGNKYELNGIRTPNLEFKSGGIYTFIQDDRSMNNHPMYFSETNNGILNSGVPYESGVQYFINGSAVTQNDYVTNFATATTRKIVLTVDGNTPATLYYNCYYHLNMHNTADITIYNGDRRTPDASVYFDLFNDGGTRWMGAWITNTGYLINDVVRHGARTYICTQNHTSDNIEPTDTAYWDLYNDGISWQGNWDIATEYKIGDAVEYATNSYISIIPNNTGNQPDLDNAKWNLLSQGDTNGLHTTRGDIVVRGPVNIERLPIGPAGSYLYSDGTDVKWGQQNPSNTFYVSLTGDDVNGDGRTPATAWRTLRHACDETYNAGQCSISIFAGTYEEQCPVKVGRGVVIEGQGLGAVTITPNNSRDEGYGVGISDDGSTPNANSELFHVNNGARIRNIVFRGFGAGSVQVSLDPGYGPDDTSVWITSQSPYVQNCTNFSPEGTGMLIDGGLHNGGYKSMVANDWTQINSDGIGIHVRNDGRCELVSVFTYYCAIGYLAESGGKIRAVNGSSAYGELGVKADGFSQNETPLEGRLRLSADTINSIREVGSNVEILNSFKDFQGNIIYVGHTNPTSANPNISTWDNTASVPFAAKYDSGGNLDWIYTYEAPIGETDVYGTINSVVELADTYYLGGVYYDGSTNRGLVLRITKNGEIQYQKTISATNEIVDVVTDDNALFVLGNHNTNGTTIIKLNVAGIEQWSSSMDYSAGANTLKASAGCYAISPGNSVDTYEAAGDAEAQNKLFVMMRDDTNSTSILARITTLGVLEETYSYGDVTITDLVLDNGNGDGIYMFAVGHVDNGGYETPYMMRLRMDGSVAWQKELNSGTEAGVLKSCVALGESIYAAGHFNTGAGTGTQGILHKCLSNGLTDYNKVFDEGATNISFATVQLDGVNVIMGGHNDTDTVIVNVQRDSNNLGTITSGSWTFTSGSFTESDDTAAEAAAFTPEYLSPVLNANDINTLILNQTPTQSDTVVATRDGFAGIGTGVNFNVSGLARQPKAGSVLQIEGIDQDYFIIEVDGFIESFGELEDNNPNAVDMLIGNKTFLQDETIGWIDANYTIFTYNEAKCRRDFGLIIDAVRRDVALGTNHNTVTAGIAYARGSAAVVQNNQVAQTGDAIRFLRDEVLALLNVADNATATARATTGFNEIIDVLENGEGNADTITYPVPAGTAQNVIDTKDQIQANKDFLIAEVTAWIADNYPALVYDSAKCERDVGYILDALTHDVLYGGNTATLIAATAYYEGTANYLGGAGEETATAAAYDHLATVINDVVQGIVVTPTTGNAEAQNTVYGSATATEGQILQDLLQIIEDVITAGNINSIAATVEPTTSWVDQDILDAYNEINSARLVLTNDSITYIDENIGFNYDETTCRRDIGLIIDALAEDLDSSTPGSYEQNDHSLDAGLAYWSGVNSVLPPNQRIPTYAALNYMSGLLTNVMNQLDPSVTYSATPRYNGSTPEAGTPSIVANNMSAIVDIATNGITAAPTRVASGVCRISIEPALTSNLTPNDNTNIYFREAFSQVRMTGHDFLDIGTGGFADTNYPVIIQADYTQQPNQERETLAQNGGRVFYVTTDQDGNFRVGDYFKIEQATGRATLSSEEFDLSGLNELQLGSITAGKAGATINEFSTDGTMADNSDAAVPTERAVVTYVGDQIELALARGGGTSHIALPVGTTAQRPQPPSVGYFRYNGDNGALEVYGNSGTWEAAGSVRWIITSTNVSINKSEAYMVDTTGGGVTVTLPATPNLGDTIRLMDLAGTFDTNNCTVARNGENIMGLAEDLILSTENAAIGLVYSNATYGWKLIEVL